MANLGAMRTQLRTLLDETDTANSHFSDSELNEFINQGVVNLGSLIEYPRSFLPLIQGVAGQANYDIAAVTNRIISIVGIFWGSRSTDGDLRQMDFRKFGSFTSSNQSWYQTNAGTTGRPTRVMLLDRDTLWVDPKPSAAEATTGKGIHLYVSTVPAVLSADIDVPNLPLAYHDLVQFYAAHLAYLGKLNNPTVANQQLALYDKKRKELEARVTKESDLAVCWDYQNAEESEVNGLAFGNIWVD